MIERLKDAALLRAAMDATPALKQVNVDLNDWISNDRNVAFCTEDGDCAAFEAASTEGLFIGHYFYVKARGRKAIDLTCEVCRKMFQEYGAKVLMGLTPVEHKAALWMNRQIGAKGYQIVDTEEDPCQIFVLTEDDLERKIKE